MLLSGAVVFRERNRKRHADAKIVFPQEIATLRTAVLLLSATKTDQACAIRSRLDSLSLSLSCLLLLPEGL